MKPSRSFLLNLAVVPNDKAAIDSIIQGSKYEIQSLRQYLKLYASEHVQTKELAQVESEKKLWPKS